MNSNSKPPTDLLVVPSAPPVITKANIPLPEFVGILFSDVKREFFATEEAYITEKDAENLAVTVAGYLEKMGIRVKIYPGNADSFVELKHDTPDMVFNLVDTVEGQEALAASIPGALELLGIPYTGAGILAKSLDNKFLTRKLLQQAGVPINNYQLFNTSTEQLNENLKFPLISKLNQEHGGLEMEQSAIAEDEKQLRARVKSLISTYKQPVIVEEYIVGREITAVVFEGLNRKVYMAEAVFSQNETKYKIKSFDVQWLEEGWQTYHYEKYENDRMKEDIKKAFEALKMYDYAKFDIRIDSSDRYYIIDANSNPAFGPKESYSATATILDMYGISFTDILQRLMLNTMREDIMEEAQQPS